MRHDSAYRDFHLLGYLLFRSRRHDAAGLISCSSETHLFSILLIRVAAAMLARFVVARREMTFWESFPAGAPLPLCNISYSR